MDKIVFVFQQPSFFCVCVCVLFLMFFAVFFLRGSTSGEISEEFMNAVQPEIGCFNLGTRFGYAYG